MRSNGRGKSLAWRLKNIWADTLDAWGELRMHRRFGKFKWSMVGDFLLGTYRFYFPELVRKSVMSRINRRVQAIKPECVEAEACSDCSCALPELAYSNKVCGCMGK